MKASYVLHALQIALRQLCSRSARILGNNLLQNAFYLVGMTQAALNISQLVERVRHFGMLGVQLADLGKGLACRLQITLGKVHFTQPVLGIARILTVRVFAQKGSERQTGLVEVLGFDQVESSIVIELLFRRIARLGTGSGLGSRRCCITGGISATSRRITPVLSKRMKRFTLAANNG